MRELIDRVMNEVAEIYPRFTAVLINAPTGMGKTYNSHVPFLKFHDRDLVRGFIYVAPMRALVRQQVRNFIERLGEFSVAYQSMDINLKVEVGGGEVTVVKNPMLSSDVNVSTIDSFMFNLMRMPVELLNKPVKWRYMTYRSYIFTSYVFLDEVHLLIEGSKAPLAALLLGFRELVISHTPTVIASATLGEKRIRCLATGNCGKQVATYAETVRGKIKVFKLWSEDSINCGSDYCIETIRDRDWEAVTNNQRFIFEEVNENDVQKIVNDYGGGILIIRNTVRDAVSTYKRVSNLFGRNDVALLHGKLDEVDRDVNARNMSNARVVIGTDAIGVGVHLRHTNVLIMDVPPNIDVFIQRVGRICRDLERNENNGCRVYVIKGRDNEDLPKYYVDLRDKLGSFNWRLPYDCCDRKGYEKLIDDYTEISKPDIVTYQDLDRLLEPLIFDQKGLRDKYRDHCNLVRDSILIRGVTDVSEENALVYSLPLSMDDVITLIKDYVDKINLAVYTLDFSNLSLRRVNIDEQVRNEIFEILKHGDCNAYFEANSKLISYMEEKVGSLRGFGVYWGIDMSRLYERGLGLVI